MSRLTTRGERERSVRCTTRPGSVRSQLADQRMWVPSPCRAQPSPRPGSSAPECPSPRCPSATLSASSTFSTVVVRVPHPADHPRPVGMIAVLVAGRGRRRPPLVVTVGVGHAPTGLRGRPGSLPPLRRVAEPSAPPLYANGTCTVWYIQPCAHRKPAALDAAVRHALDAGIADLLRRAAIGTSPGCSSTTSDPAKGCWSRSPRRWRNSSGLPCWTRAWARRTHGGHGSASRPRRCLAAGAAVL